MALASMYLDPGGFDGVDADDASPVQVALVFDDTHGPFDRVEDGEGTDVLVRSTRTKRWYRIERSVLYDRNDAVAGSELEIFESRVRR